MLEWRTEMSIRSAGLLRQAMTNAIARLDLQIDLLDPEDSFCKFLLDQRVALASAVDQMPKNIPVPRSIR